MLAHVMKTYGARDGSIILSVVNLIPSVLNIIDIDKYRHIAKIYSPLLILHEIYIHTSDVQYIDYIDYRDILLFIS